MRNIAIPLAVVLVLAACSDDPTETTKPPVVETHLIRDVDYVKNTSYWVDDPGSFVGASVAGFEVWRTVIPADLVVDPTITRVPGWAIPDPPGDGASFTDAASRINSGSRPRAYFKPYPDSVVSVSLSPESFSRLELGADYAVVPDALNPSMILGIELLEPIPVTAQRALAIRYLNSLGTPIGGSYATYGVIDPATGEPVVPNSSADTLMLEMIKPRDPRPTGPFGSTWPFAMRHVYDLGFTDIDPATLTIVIEDVLSVRKNPRRPEGSQVPYLRIFGLDQTDASGSGPPDGLVDPTFVDFARGRLTFPDLRAFAPDSARVAEWTDGQFAFDGPYQGQYETAKRIYTELLNSTQEMDVHQYVIRAVVTIPAGE